MNWLDNPIANMHGPQFLGFYAAVIVTTLGLLWFFSRRVDATTGQPVPPVPTEPDPYAIAYLRGGLGEVARVAVFELLQREYIEGKEGIFKETAKHPGLRHLHGVPRIAYDWLKTKGSLTAREVFSSRGLVTQLEGQAESELRRPLEADQLLVNSHSKSLRRRWAGAATALMLGLGGYKLAVALTKGYTNIVFLVLMLIFALVASIVTALSMPSLTLRGRKYLDALNLAFDQLTHRPEARQESSYLPLMVGLFGVSALGGTSFAYYADDLERMQQVAQASGDAGLASCGSSCGGGGGGCGGGCGGCGS